MLGKLTFEVLLILY